MARFSGKIHSVKFVDTSEKTIEILYGEDSKKLFSYILSLDYTNQDFLDLLEEISIEEIQDKTRDYYQSIDNNKNLVVHNMAKAMFEEWIKNAQADLDNQDKERYEIFESYREKQEEEYNVLLEELFKEADAYKEEQLKILQTEIDVQIEQRYKEVETYKQEQLDILQKELDEQVERRVAEGFKNVDEYREKQLSILQTELDTQVENRYKEADEYKEQQLEILQKEIDTQVEGRFREADAYKEEQLKVLQSEIDEQAQDMKADLLSKFKSNTTSVRYTAEKVAKYIIDNFEDEDTVFKTKLEIFNLPEVKNSKDREMKMKVRKAKTVPEIFAAYHDIQYSNS